MRQIFHIFRKDARHLGIPIGLLIVLIAAYDVVAKAAVNNTARDGSPMQVLFVIILPLYAWSLITMAIQDEVLPGDTQFWITRPYKRISLLISKLLFVVVFVNVPLFLSDIAILSFNGFWTWSEMPDLVLRQLVMSLWVVFPAFAIASVTRSLAHFTSFLVLCCVGTIILAMVPSLFLHESLGISVSVWGKAILCGSVLLCLAAVNVYMTHRILISRMLIGLGFFSLTAVQLWASLMIALSASRQQVRPFPTTGYPVTVSIDLDDIASQKSRVITPEFVGFELPVHLTNLPNGITRVSVFGKVLLASDGQKLAEGDAIAFESIEVPALNVQQPMSLERKLLQVRLKRPEYFRVAGRTVSLQLSLDGQAFRDTPFTRVPLETRRFEIAGIGHCQPSDTTAFLCRTALREPKPFLCYVARGATPISNLYQQRASSAESIFPVFAGLDPIETWQLPVTIFGQGRDLVFLKPGKPIPLIGSVSGQIRVPELGPGGQ